jgi:hypothetical protein
MNDKKCIYILAYESKGHFLPAENEIFCLPHLNQFVSNANNEIIHEKGRNPDLPQPTITGE